MLKRDRKIFFLRHKWFLGLVLLMLTLLLAGCGKQGMSKYTYEFMGSFDTLIQFMGYAESAEAFETMAQEGQTEFETLNRLFDRYHDYAGINNIKTINDAAGGSPVKVDQEILDLLQLSKRLYGETGGVCNIAMGPVLSLWHDARTEGLDNPEAAVLPDMKKLQDASRLCDIGNVLVDEAAGTVFLKEKGMSLDVGAVAKGYACKIVAESLKAKGYDSFLISGGGNIVAVGSPKDGLRPKWGIGIQNPDGNALNPDDPPLDIAYVSDEAVVTSGDYQRTYVVQGKAYHHLIDPKTLMPATYFRAVTVVSKDSGLADFMSTTLFLLPLEEGRPLAAVMGVDVLWILPDDTQVATEGMKTKLKKLGGAVNKY